jgi:hypothetical protein
LTRRARRRTRSTRVRASSFFGSRASTRPKSARAAVRIRRSGPLPCALPRPAP